MFESLTEHTRQCLQAAGWCKERRVETTAYEAALRGLNYFVGQAAIEFLSSFGDLRIRYPIVKVPSREDSCHFHVQRAVAGAEPLGIEEYEAVIGSRLTVIGEAFCDHFTLTMAENGAIYASFDDYLFKLGDTGIDGLNTICHDREGDRIDYVPIQLAKNIFQQVHPDSTPLSEDAQKRLRAGGWPGIQGDDFLADLSIEMKIPLESPKAVAEFLRQFEGVRIACAPWGDNAQSAVEVSAQSAICRFTSATARSLPAHFFDEYHRRVGQRLFAVGELENSSFVFLMNEYGRVVAGMRELPDILWLVGKSGYDAINNLCVGAPRLRLI